MSLPLLRRLAAACVAIAIARCAVAAGDPGPRQVARADDCLGRALQEAAPDVTVAQLREQCAAPPADAVPPSVIGARDRQEQGYWARRLALMPHRPSYFLPFSYSRDLVRLDDDDTVSSSRPAGQRSEIKFQLSLKLPLIAPPDASRSALFVAYTWQAWWQAYQLDRSNPFREYNHEPELFLSMPLDRRIGAWRLGQLNLGFAHQSNGRENARSRSWNRLYVDVRAENGPWWVSIKPWYRLPERLFGAGSLAEDDNADITRFYGHGELRIGRVGGEGFSHTLMLRRHPSSTGKGAIQYDLSRPTGFNPRLHWYVQAFAGYGESLIDYDRKIRRIGVGLMFGSWY